ncbi:MAG: hypothetical protein QMD65_02000 [Patescibacteria group bacterium]|nr:hypothetical protein [Patescibacteria group bacterium]
MINNLLSKVAYSVIVLLTSLGLINGVPSDNHNLGILVPSSPSLIDTYLVSPISDSATSMTLAVGTTRDKQTLTGFQCFTLDANQPNTEFVCGNASGTSITSLTRGVNLLNPNATTTYVYSHRRFASVQTTDYPTIQFLVRKMNGVDSLDNALIYSSEPAWNYGTHQLVTWDKSKDYTDSVSYAGTSDANFSTKGIIQLATTSELIAGTATGTTGAYLGVPNLFFNATSSANRLVPVTKEGGKLSQGFLDLTEGFTFSGGLTSTGALVQSGTSTFGGSVTFTSGKTITADGNWTFGSYPMGVSRTIIYTSSGSFVPPAGVTTIRVQLIGGGGNGAAGANGWYSSPNDYGGASGGSGGSGGQIFPTPVLVTPTQSYTITVGGIAGDTTAFGLTAIKGTSASGTIAGAAGTPNGVAGNNGSASNTCNSPDRAPSGASTNSGIYFYKILTGGLGGIIGDGHGSSGSSASSTLGQYGYGGGGGGGGCGANSTGGAGGSGRGGAVIINY